MLMDRPSNSAEVLPSGMAKLLKAGSDLILEVHYTPNGKAVQDKPSVALTYATGPPVKRVHTLQMDNSTFRIPPGERDYRVTVSGTLPNDAQLLSLYPHMHLRGKTFEFDRIGTNGQPQPMLRVTNYDFHWQLSYYLKEPLALPRGTRLQWVATFDNSRNNPANPDPTAEVRYGHQSWEEMMIGFFTYTVEGPRATTVATR